MLGLAEGPRPSEGDGIPLGTRGERGALLRRRIDDSELPLLIATYRLLASLVLEPAAGRQVVEVRAWEWPWVREAVSIADGRLLRVKMPAGAILSSHKTSAETDRMTGHLSQVLLVPDLGTAPVVRYREMLRRLVALREAAWFGDEAADAEPDVVIATPDTDRTGARRSAWLKLLDRIGLRSGQGSIRVRVLTWESVAGIVRRKRSTDIVGDGAYRRSGGEGGVVRVVLESPAPTRSRERLLHVIGRHPCLTVGQLADLLGTRVDRIRRLEMELIHDGLLRQIDFAELPPGGTGLTCDEFRTARPSGGHEEGTTLDSKLAWPRPSGSCAISRTQWTRQP